MRKTLLSSLKRHVDRVSDYLYHADHRKEALGLLASVERDHGPLSPQLRARADEYAAEVLGSRRYAPWLYVYTAIAGDFREGWIPDNYYGKVVVPRMQGAYRSISGIRHLSRRLFSSDGFPDIAYAVNGLFHDVNGNIVAAHDLPDLLLDGHDRVVFKRDSSGRGKGVLVLDREQVSVAQLSALGNGVIQAYVDQHPTLGAFMPSAVATLRLTTVIDNAGRCSLRTAILRLPRAGSTHVLSSNGIRVPVSRENGSFAEIGFSDVLQRISAHPDTGIRFAGKVMPSFDQCVETVVRLHARLPYARCIGWDLTVDTEGRPQLLEWNAGHNGIKLAEPTQGPCFADMGWERLWRQPPSHRLPR